MVGFMLLEDKRLSPILDRIDWMNRIYYVKPKSLDWAIIQ